MKIFNSIILSTFSLLWVNFATAQELILTPGPVSCEYKTKDLNEGFDVNSDSVIICEEESCVVSNKADVEVSDGLVSINANGTYIIQGTFNGQIRVSVTENDFVHLVLNSVTITSNDGPALYVTEADKITLTLLGENTLSDSSNYSDVVDEEPDACLFVDSDLSINGSGSLTVTGQYGDAIRCKKDLKMVSGNIIVPNAVERGIKAKNSICIKDGTIDVNSSNTGIKVTRDDDAEKGYIVVDGGNIAVSTGKDGIHAETHLTIRGGYIDIQKSKEGLEGQMIDILGGEIHVLASDDGINASKITNSTETESIEIKSTEIETNETKSVENESNGNTNNDNSGENDDENKSISGKNNMGENDMKGSDMKGNDMKGDENATGTDGSVYINIVGGKTYVTVDGNDVDGIDSNGILYIGGEAEVYASIKGGNIYGNMAVLDAEGTNVIVEGATVIATSGEMGNSENKDGNKNGNMTETMKNDNVNMNNNNNNKRKRQESQNENMIGNMNDNMKPMFNNTMENDINNMNRTMNGNVNENMKPMFNNTMDNNMNNMNGNMPNGNMGGMNESGSVNQPYIQTTVNTQNAGTQIIIKDRNDQVIVSFTPNVSYSSILITSPSMIAGENYTIITGDDSITAMASEADTGSVSAPSVISSTDTGFNLTSFGYNVQPKYFTIFILLTFIYYII